MMEHVNSLPVNAENCSGCTACASICPTSAIAMKDDEDGFSQPQLDVDLCINCKLCFNVCPVLYPNKHSKQSVAYAARTVRDEIFRTSSSGGVATEFSMQFIEEGGVVIGAAMEDFRVHHICVDNVNDLHKLQGSKYVQSDLEKMFLKIRLWLRQNKKVLFIGTPCQVAGLRNFLQKDFEKLLTIDIICHAVPSPMILKKYLKEMKNRYPDTSAITFRDKIQDGNIRYALTLYNKEKNIIYRETSQKNHYMKGFSNNLFIRQSCAKCRFTTVERAGDITLGDFWKLNEFNKEFAQDKGISLVICNTTKGNQFFKSCVSRGLSILTETPIEIAVNGQAQMRNPTKISPYRNTFFYQLRKTENIINLLDRYLFPVGILNFPFANNYGAVLIPFAMKRILEKMGYPCDVINYYRGKNRPTNEPFDRFRKIFLNLGHRFSSINELQKSSHRWKRIVVGSDQVWRIGDTEAFMLGWADGEKTLISYGASFGGNDYTGNLPVSVASQMLRRFDSISVREKSGVDICKRKFNVHAVQVLDPTLLLNASDYDEVIRDADINENLFSRPIV